MKGGWGEILGEAARQHSVPKADERSSPRRQSHHNSRISLRRSSAVSGSDGSDGSEGTARFAMQRWDDDGAARLQWGSSAT